MARTIPPVISVSPSLNYIGVDPGSDGGLGLIVQRRLVGYVKYSKGQSLVDRLLSWQSEYGLDESNTVCIMEEVHAIYGSGAKSTFNFGRNFGEIIGIIRVLKIPIRFVPPLDWKKYYKLDKDKDKSRKKVKELYPGHDFKASARCTTAHDGICEGVLLGHYGLENEIQ